MRIPLSTRIVRPIIYALSVGLIAAIIWFGKPIWRSLLGPSETTAESADVPLPPVDEPKIVRLGPQARANLNLASKPAQFGHYWKTIQIPGIIEDRPGISDRAITVPIAGVISQIYAFEGDIIQAGDKMFTVRLASEYLQKTQSQLFRATREVQILNQEISRIQGLIDSGTLAGKRKLELQQQISRQNAQIDAFRQELGSRGLSDNEIEQVEKGKFLSSIDVYAPSPNPSDQHTVRRVNYSKSNNPNAGDFLEIQQLKVELGQQVDAGQALAVLANHQSLYVKGHAFKKEAAFVAQATEQNWNVAIEFSEDSAKNWPELDQEFRIRNLSNTTDPNSRTFDFFVPLTNQARIYEKDNRPFVIWRFRPGQRVNISVPIERLENVLALPIDSVVFEGPEAFVFLQSGDLFYRIPIRVVYQNRYHVVVANDGAISPGFYLAQNSAASLNRVMKAQAASGTPANFHVHADGTVHANH